MASPPVGSTWQRPARAGLSKPPDTFFVGPAPVTEPQPLDVRDPRNRNLFVLGDDELDLDRLKQGSKVGAPTVSASMATAVLAYSGIAVKMLVDKRLDAQLSTMFMVDYQPGAVAHPHDHPFEESYYMLEGEVDVVADGDRYTLEPGDAFWTGVGCVHAFYETRGRRVRWLETSAPGPPDRHSYPLRARLGIPRRTDPQTEHRRRCPSRVRTRPVTGCAAPQTRSANCREGVLDDAVRPPDRRAVQFRCCQFIELVQFL